MWTAVYFRLNCHTSVASAWRLSIPETMRWHGRRGPPTERGCRWFRARWAAVESPSVTCRAADRSSPACCRRNRTRTANPLEWSPSRSRTHDRSACRGSAAAGEDRQLSRRPCRWRWRPTSTRRTPTWDPLQCPLALRCSSRLPSSTVWHAKRDGARADFSGTVSGHDRRVGPIVSRLQRVRLHVWWCGCCCWCVHTQHAQLESD